LAKQPPERMQPAQGLQPGLRALSQAAQAPRQPWQRAAQPMPAQAQLWRQRRVPQPLATP
jgi:hypothetical protein